MPQLVIVRQMPGAQIERYQDHFARLAFSINPKAVIETQIRVWPSLLGTSGVVTLPAIFVAGGLRSGFLI